MSIKLAIIGDVMLGRVIGKKYQNSPYDVVTGSLVSKISASDYVLANLESPILHSNTENNQSDHLQFKGNPDILTRLKWIDSFSLSNNHINDFGTQGMDETMDILKKVGFDYNGLFEKSEAYKPLVIDKNGEKIAFVHITDMMNVPFEQDCHLDILRVGEPRVLEIIDNLHKQGFLVILFAHAGILFSRFPNPIIREYLHKCCDVGADIVVTAHSHCLGGMEYYKQKPIFHSLGDFIMDGSSFRRRRSGVLELEIQDRKIVSWNIVPAEIDLNYVTGEPPFKVSNKIMRSFSNVSKALSKHTNDYEKFFRWQYKIEMFNHSISTLSFLYRQRGLKGMLKIVSQRMEEVFRMFSWMAKDRSKDQRDDEAIRSDRKKFTQDELFNQ